MKILIVSTYNVGGAANACLRLHQGLLKEGVDSKVLLRDKKKSIPATFQFKHDFKIKSINSLKIFQKKMSALFKRIGPVENNKEPHNFIYPGFRSKGLELFSFPNSGYDITNSKFYQEADVINLHWVANFIDYDLFFRKNTKPVVWTLHDMNPFSGGEHYVESWLGMDDEGVPINRKIREEEKTLFSKIQSFKMKVMNSVSNVTLVAPSKWLRDEALKSEVFKDKRVEHIPYGIDCSVFKPRDRKQCRSILKIPQDKTVVLFVADYLTNHRKGYRYLTKALELLRCDDVILCAIGGNAANVDSKNKTIELGQIEDEHMMATAYAAADVFVIPSLMDNFPNTVLESLLCGTPVIGFPVGGLRDMIDHGVNGLLAEQVNSQSLSSTIADFLRKKDDFDRYQIREITKNKYALSIQAKAYVNLFERVLDSKEIREKQK